MNKFKTFMAVVILLLVMVATTSVSFVYWKNGITGNENNTDLQINIGTGESIETVVNLGQVSVGEKALVPKGRVTDENTQTDKLTFTVAVTWASQNDLTGTTDENLFESHVGKLNISYVGLYLTTDTSETNHKNTTGFSGNLLFEVNFTQVYNINGNETVNVEFTVKMNETANRDQYELFAGQAIEINLVFKVLSTFDIEMVD